MQGGEVYEDQQSRVEVPLLMLAILSGAADLQGGVVRNYQAYEMDAGVCELFEIDTLVPGLYQSTT